MLYSVRDVIFTQTGKPRTATRDAFGMKQIKTLILTESESEFFMLKSTTSVIFEPILVTVTWCGSMGCSCVSSAESTQRFLEHYNQPTPEPTTFFFLLLSPPPPPAVAGCGGKCGPAIRVAIWGNEDIYKKTSLSHE